MFDHEVDPLFETEIFTVPETVDPSLGEEIETAPEDFAPFATVTVIPPEPVRLPDESNAVARRL
jgi:hypothetical protein